jgi:hypothetical protein
MKQWHLFELLHSIRLLLGSYGFRMDFKLDNPPSALCKGIEGNEHHRMRILREENQLISNVCGGFLGTSIIDQILGSRCRQ